MEIDILTVACDGGTAAGMLVTREKFQEKISESVKEVLGGINKDQRWIRVEKKQQQKSNLKGKNQGKNNYRDPGAKCI